MVKTYLGSIVLGNSIEDSKTLLDDGSRLRIKKQHVNWIYKVLKGIIGQDAT